MYQNFIRIGRYGSKVVDNSVPLLLLLIPYLKSLIIYSVGIVT